MNLAIKNISVLVFALLLSATGNCQMKVKFLAADGLEVSADLYYVDKDYPYVVMFHDDNSSRGEFEEIAVKISRLKYNCLAVDLRNGSESRFVKNETAIRARKESINLDNWECRKDITAAINYAYRRNNKSVILMGSSFSASLALYYGTNNKKVNAVIAFNPGEFFERKFNLSKSLKYMNKPVFIGSTKKKEKYSIQLTKMIKQELITVFAPSVVNGTDGCKALWNGSEGYKEYWFALTMFFKSLN